MPAKDELPEGAELRHLRAHGWTLADIAQEYSVTDDVAGSTRKPGNLYRRLLLCVQGTRGQVVCSSTAPCGRMSRGRGNVGTRLRDLRLSIDCTYLNNI